MFKCFNFELAERERINEGCNVNFSFCEDGRYLAFLLILKIQYCLSSQQRKGIILGV